MKKKDIYNMRNVAKSKLNRMKKTAELYIAFYHYDGLARIDTVCIILDDCKTVRHFEHYIGVT